MRQQQECISDSIVDSSEVPPIFEKSLEITLSWTTASQDR